VFICFITGTWYLTMPAIISIINITVLVGLVLLFSFYYLLLILYIFCVGCPSWRNKLHIKWSILSLISSVDVLLHSSPSLKHHFLSYLGLLAYWDRSMLVGYGVVKGVFVYRERRSVVSQTRGSLSSSTWTHPLQTARGQPRRVAAYQEAGRRKIRRSLER